MTRRNSSHLVTTGNSDHHQSVRNPLHVNSDILNASNLTVSDKGGGKSDLKLQK